MAENHYISVFDFLGASELQKGKFGEHTSEFLRKM
jgi:hypothetical protein